MGVAYAGTDVDANADVDAGVADAGDQTFEDAVGAVNDLTCGEDVVAGVDDSQMLVDVGNVADQSVDSNGAVVVAAEGVANETLLTARENRGNKVEDVNMEQQ